MQAPCNVFQIQIFDLKFFSSNVFHTNFFLPMFFTPNFFFKRFFFFTHRRGKAQCASPGTGRWATDPPQTAACAALPCRQRAERGPCLQSLWGTGGKYFFKYFLYFLKYFFGGQIFFLRKNLFKPMGIKDKFFRTGDWGASIKNKY